MSVNNLAINSPTTLVLTVPSRQLGLGNYNLINYTGSLSGNLSNLNDEVVGYNLSSHSRQQVAYVNADHAIALQVTGSNSANLVWKGATGNPTALGLGYVELVEQRLARHVLRQRLRDPRRHRHQRQRIARRQLGAGGVTLNNGSAKNYTLPARVA